MSQHELARQLARSRPATQDVCPDAGAAAAQVDTARSRIRRWESGAESPLPPSLTALAEVLGVHPFALLDPSTPMSLSSLRALRGLLQADLAAQLGVSRARIGHLERGGEPSTENLRALAETLKVTDAQLMDARNGSTTVGQWKPKAAGLTSSGMTPD